MSLINQMLKDLEAGRTPTEKKPAMLQSLRSVAQVDKRFLFHPAWLIVVSVVLVIALISFFRLGHAKAIKQHAQPKTMTAAIERKVQTNMQVSVPGKSVAVKPIGEVHTVDVAPKAVVQAGQAEPMASSVPLNLPKQVTQVDKPADPVVAKKQSVQADAPSVQHEQSLSQLQRSELSPTVDVKHNVPMNNQQKVSQLYEEAQQALDNGDDEAAIAALKQLLIRKTDYVEARELLATVLLTDNNVEDADDVVNVGLKRMPHYAPFTNIKARILMSQGQISKAIDELNQAAPELRNSPDYYALLAALYQQSEKFILAAQLYHQLVQLDPVNAVWWMGLGIALESAEKNNAALEAFQHATKGQGLSATAKAYVQQQITKLS